MYAKHMYHIKPKKIGARHVNVKNDEEHIQDIRPMPIPTSWK